jgi:hypothetical protein
LYYVPSASLGICDRFASPVTRCAVATAGGNFVYVPTTARPAVRSATSSLLDGCLADPPTANHESLCASGATLLPNVDQARRSLPNGRPAAHENRLQRLLQRLLGMVSRQLYRRRIPVNCLLRRRGS